MCPHDYAITQVLFCLDFCVTPEYAQGSILTILRIYLGGARSTIRGASHQIHVGNIQDKHPTSCTISLAPETIALF